MTHLLWLILSVTFLSFTTGCKTRTAADLSSAAVVNSDGTVFLFYRDGQNVVIKQCADHTVLKAIDDCKTKLGTRDASVPVNGFKHQLIYVLRMTDRYFDKQTQASIDAVKRDEPLNIQTDEQRVAELTSEADRVRAFIGSYGAGNVDAAKLKAIEKQLAKLNGELAAKRVQSAELQAGVKQINFLVEQVVEDLISQPKIVQFLEYNSYTGFVFNVLKAYVDTPGLGMSFRLIKAGEFYMGSGPAEAERATDEGQHLVKITTDFEIGTTEVNQMQWFSVMGDNPSYFSEKRHCPESFQVIRGMTLCPTHPVESVTMLDIADFLRRLNEQNPGAGYRLPTEAEWEYAARAGTYTVYNIGNNITKQRVNHQNRENGTTVGVGTLNNANAWGLFDMHGNVWEAVSNIEPSKDTPRFLPGIMALRGGSWYTWPQHCRSANRKFIIAANMRDSRKGLRLVRSAR